MEGGHAEGEQEHGQDLTAHRSGNELFVHAHLLKDLKPGPVVVALDDLLVVDDEHRGHQEQDAQQDTEEQEAAVEGVDHLQVAGLCVVAQTVEGGRPRRGGEPGHEAVGKGLVLLLRAADVQTEPHGGQGARAVRSVIAVVDLIEMDQHIVVRHDDIEDVVGHKVGQRAVRRHVRKAVLDGELLSHDGEPVGQSAGHFPQRHLVAAELIVPAGQRLPVRRRHHAEVAVVEIHVLLSPGGRRDHLAAVHQPAAGQGGIKDVVFHGNAGLLLGLGDHILHLSAALLRGGEEAGADVVGIARLNDVVQPGVQADGAGHRHQHHGGENADVGKAHGVLLHAVEHTGHADEVVGPVIVVFALFQQLQHGDAPGQKQAVGADDNQNDGDEKDADRHYDLGGGQGDVVADAQCEHADDHQQPAGPGLLFAHIAAPEQLDGLGNDDLRQIGQQQEHENAAEERRGEGNDGGLERVGHADVKVDEV